MADQTYLHSLESVPLNTIIKEEYRNYQIYTLMDRAIPYLQDGLKPCQRRILFTLWKNSTKGLMKVSSATGLVLTLHPHGPASIESSIVNMAQDFAFTNNYPVIDKKGYFGERMEPVAAASRYIECRLGKVSEILLFDDMNQVQMIPNYDEKVMEPEALLPKLPLMLLNGSEGIGTGFSSVVPSFHHKEIIASMLSVVKTGKTKPMTPYFRHYGGELTVEDSGRIITKMGFTFTDEKIYITELPKGYNAEKIYKHLNKYIDKDYLKDYIDSSVDNDIRIELIFKRGQQPTFEEVEKEIGVTTTINPNYTLISERGVKIFNSAEEIIEIFTLQRLEVVKKRYELLAMECLNRLTQNNEIIRFIQEKHYDVAHKCQNRKAFVEYLQKKEFSYSDYLADMPIYRMTKEEVEKRMLMIKDDKVKLKEYKAIAKSEALVKEKLYQELVDVRDQLSELMDKRDKDRKKLYKDLHKKR